MSPRSAVLIDLDRAEPRGVPWRRVAIAGLVALGLATLPGQERPTPSAPAPSLEVVQPTASQNARLPLPTLRLSSTAGDAQLTTFPDWLANEPPPAALRGVVAVRGTMGIASVEGVTIINWTERGISYRLESPTRTISELVRIADALR